MSHVDKDVLKGKKRDWGEPPAEWYFLEFPDHTSAVDWLNWEPVTPPGTALMSHRPDGSVVLYVHLGE
jgi:hypothetical protein